MEPPTRAKRPPQTPFHGFLLTSPTHPNTQQPQPTTQIHTEIQNAISILTHWSSEVKLKKVCENTLKFSLDLFVL